MALVDQMKRKTDVDFKEPDLVKSQKDDDSETLSDDEIPPHVDTSNVMEISLKSIPRLPSLYDSHLFLFSKHDIRSAHLLKNEVISFSNKEVIQRLLGDCIKFICDETEKATKLTGLGVSPMGGFGVFALEHIPKGTMLGDYQGKGRSLAEINHQGLINRSYCMELFDSKDTFIGLIDAEKARNFGGFINHGYPNVIAEQEGNKIILKTIVDINSGEPLYLDYGQNYLWLTPPVHLNKFHVKSVEDLYQKNAAYYEENAQKLPDDICDAYHLPKKRDWNITPLVKAILADDAKRVKQYASTQAGIPCLLLNNFDSKLEDFKAQPLVMPIQIATAKGNTEIIKQLLSSGQCEPHMPSVFSGITPLLVLLRFLRTLQDKKKFDTLKIYAIDLLNQCIIFVDDLKKLNLLDAAIRLGDNDILETLFKRAKELNVHLGKYMYDRDKDLPPFMDLDDCIEHKSTAFLGLMFQALEDNIVIPHPKLISLLKLNKIIRTETLKQISPVKQKTVISLIEKYPVIFEATVNRRGSLITKASNQNKERRWQNRDIELEFNIPEISIKALSSLEKNEQKKLYDDFMDHYDSRETGARHGMMAFLSKGIDNILLNVFSWYLHQKETFSVSKLLQSNSVHEVLKKYILFQASYFWDKLSEDDVFKKTRCEHYKAILDTDAKITPNDTQDEYSFFAKLCHDRSGCEIEELAALVNYNRSNKSEVFTLIQESKSSDTTFDIEYQKFFNELFLKKYGRRKSNYGERTYNYADTDNHIKDIYGVYEIEYKSKTYTFSLIHLFKSVKEKDPKILAFIVEELIKCEYLLSVFKNNILIAYFKAFDFKEAIEPLSVKKGKSADFFQKMLLLRDSKRFQSDCFAKLSEMCTAENIETINAYIDTHLSDLNSFEIRATIKEVLYPVKYGKKICFMLDILMQNPNENLIYWLLKTNETDALKFIPNTVFMTFLKTNRSENFLVFIKSYLDITLKLSMLYQFFNTLDAEALHTVKILFLNFKLLKVVIPKIPDFFDKVEEVLLRIEKKGKFEFEVKPLKEEQESSKEMMTSQKGYIENPTLFKKENTQKSSENEVITLAK